ncbi:hypothetical protein ABPG77_000299 [Micractinium sp. CCAP 211/92]
MGPLPERCCCGGWCTRWRPSEELKRHYPPKHTDFRDHTPEPLADIYNSYAPVEERWTHGLLEMWFPKLKPVKASVHIPCWNSFHWNPLLWRGPCFGRTLTECYWTGLRQTRWARAVYAANLGREYTMPFANVGRHGYKSSIKALCWMFWLMGCVSGCGVGQLATCCGSFLIINFSAWYSCHARERLRRRYNLPPSFCLPPGIDDCLVHFYCFYCASHQELRELAVRGIDGPGMHILDVLPDSFPRAPGIEQAVAERRKVVEYMLQRPPKMFRSRGHQGEPRLRGKVADAAVKLAEAAKLPDEGEDLPLPEQALEGSVTESTSEGATDVEGAGWLRYSPPTQQEMRRGRPFVEAEPAPAEAGAAAAGVAEALSGRAVCCVALYRAATAQ